MANDLKQVDAAMSQAADKIVGSKPVKRNATKSAEPKHQKTDIEKFKDFVETTGLAMNLQRKIYLVAEAWQYIMDLKNLHCRCDCTQETKTDASGDEYLVVTCLATIYDDNNVVVSTGTMQATGLESFLSDKPDFAVYGMAQTRALSRAMRNRYGYIARACGFQSTPAEEIEP